MLRSLQAFTLALLLGLAPTVVLAAKINVNTADAGTLESLDGIGQAKAAAIVDYRSRKGEFSSVEDLLEVSGIGERTLDANRDRITVE